MTYESRYILQNSTEKIANSPNKRCECEFLNFANVTLLNPKIKGYKIRPIKFCTLHVYMQYHLPVFYLKSPRLNF